MSRKGVLLAGRVLGLAGLLLLAGQAAAAPASKAPNHTSIANTRHNLTQSFLGGGAGWMNLSRNDYGQVCVYCHTPHGANSTLDAPLWNRTHKGNTYTTYDKLGTSSLTQTVSQPGINSLTCLSCHDGTVAVDSIINMPGSGRYDAGQQTAQNDTFLFAWSPGPGDNPFYGGHGTLNPADTNQYGSCMACHSPSGDQHDPSTMANFDVFYIGTDLTNDHPVGISWPGAGADFNNATGSNSKLQFFDGNGNGRADSDEIRFYKTGEGPEVECASCHDPHGVAPGGVGSQFNPTFLRVSNENSGVCLTCHIK